MERIAVDPFPSSAELAQLWSAASPKSQPPAFDRILPRSLTHLCAYDGARLIGYVNVATDGGVHAFLLDPTVHPDFRRRGVGTRLVQESALIAAQRGAHWLHVDFEADLESFYAAIGFAPTRAGLMRLETKRM